jgi:acetyl esterase/lipase
VVQVPYVHHPRPHLERDRRPGRAELGREPLGVTAQQFPLADLDEGRREAVEVTVERLAAKLSAAGSPVTLEVWPGMVHVWHLHHTRLSKGRAGLARLGSFLRSCWPAAA